MIAPADRRADDGANRPLGRQVCAVYVRILTAANIQRCAGT
jgi:hypothetical protein